jgi:prepilin-type N-terminal cleavage/methylation domain-containing protein
MSLIRKIKKDKKIYHFQGKGFTLLELLLVIIIISLASISAVHLLKASNDQKQALAVAQQYQELGTALSNYITNNYNTLLVPTTATSVPISTLITQGYLPSGFSTVNGFGSAYTVYVYKTTNAATGKMYLNGIVGSATPWYDASGNTASTNIRYDLLGAAVRDLGSQGAVTLYNAGTASGVNGSWSMTNADFPQSVTAAGQLFYRTYYGMNYDNVYLRLDGTNAPMLGSLDMGNYNINSVNNINAFGAINAGSVLANTGTIGTLNAQNVVATAMTANQVTGTGTNSTLSFNYVVASTDLNAKAINSVFSGTCNGSGTTNDPCITTFGDGTQYTSDTAQRNGIVNIRDAIVRNSSNVNGTLGNSYLKDRLPRYVLKGTYAEEFTLASAQASGNKFAYVTVPYPTDCPNPSGANGSTSSGTAYGANGTVGSIPKIEVIPQSQITQGSIGGTLTLNQTNLGNGYYNIYNTQNEYVLGANGNFATVNGATGWIVYSSGYDYGYLATAGYGGATVISTALVNTYCDFGPSSP